MLNLFLLLLLDPLCVLAVLAAGLYALSRLCLRKFDNSCPVRVCSHIPARRTKK